MKHIVFVHDQLESPHVRQLCLEAAGYRVTVLDNSQRLLELLQEQQPDLVLMDVLIEGRNGFETCRRVRMLHGPVELPVVLCSEVYRSRIFRDEAASAGAQRYLLKPMRPEVLLEELKQLLPSERDAAA